MTQACGKGEALGRLWRAQRRIVAQACGKGEALGRLWRTQRRIVAQAVRAAYEL
ncbi:MAG: hypothetical protein ACR2KG_06700 [Nocardioidaceae bacterium]